MTNDKILLLNIRIGSISGLLDPLSIKEWSSYEPLYSSVKGFLFILMPSPHSDAIDQRPLWRIGGNRCQEDYHCCRVQPDYNVNHQCFNISFDDPLHGDALWIGESRSFFAADEFLQ